MFENSQHEMYKKNLVFKTYFSSKVMCLCLSSNYALLKRIICLKKLEMQ